MELTSRQREVMSEFSGTEYRLPGKSWRTCEALEARGMLDAEMLLANVHYRSDGSAVTTYKRGYRLSAKGKKEMKRSTATRTRR